MPYLYIYIAQKRPKEYLKGVLQRLFEGSTAPTAIHYSKQMPVPYPTIECYPFSRS